MSEHHRQLALEQAQALTTDLVRTESQRERAIARALHNGATWSQIAEHLGVSSQAAHRRYRWLHYDPSSGHSWHERPLKLT